MESKTLDTVLLAVGLVIILVGFWMFKDLAIETAVVSKTVFMKYKYDWIIGMLLILFGSAVMGLVENKRFYNFIEDIRNKR